MEKAAQAMTNPEVTPQETWSAVDRYIAESIVPQDAALSEALAASKAAGLPEISVSPAQGKMLQLLAQIQGARNILEIGTLGGYSTIWLARALPDGGKLITLEVEAKHADVALANVKRAGLSELVELRLAPALESLPKLLAEARGPFDFIFIDADKNNIPHYMDWALKLARSGTVIVVDNVVRRGKLPDPNTGDASVDGVRKLHAMLAKETRVSATTIQTVGSKGYDGFTLVRVK
jgi:predicted O-methyltransferase YrrM